jgi:hypothetical protein
MNFTSQEFFEFNCPVNSGGIANRYEDFLLRKKDLNEAVKENSADNPIIRRNENIFLY